jgi:hypothetical protein
MVRLGDGPHPAKPDETFLRTSWRRCTAFPWAIWRPDEAVRCVRLSWSYSGDHENGAATRRQGWRKRGVGSCGER